MIIRRLLPSYTVRTRRTFFTSTPKFDNKKNVDTSGTLSSANTLVGGILGLAGAPTFQKGENVINLIKNDHRKAESLYEQYKSTNDKNKRQEISRELIKGLVQHSEVEQLLVYPLLKLRGNGKQQELHDKSLSEHQEQRELLYAVDQTKIDDPSHPEKLKKAMDSIKKHVEEEESDVLPRIEKNYSLEELQRLGNAFETHKYTAVTHPHPSAPLQGPAAAAANMATKPFDLARDALENMKKKM